MRTATPYEMRVGINRILNVAGIDDFRSYHFPDRDKPSAKDKKRQGSGRRNDVWAVVLGMMQGLGMTYDEVM